jgi:hypothetical protein
MEKDDKKGEILKQIKDEGISTALLLIGLGTGVTIMQLAKSKVPNPWLLPAGAFAAGFAVKLFVKNASAKDIATGIMLAGGGDIAKKGLDLAATKIPALAQISNALPALSGPGGQAYITPQSLRGDFTPATVVGTQLFR